MKKFTSLFVSGALVATSALCAMSAYAADDKAIINVVNSTGTTVYEATVGDTVEFTVSGYSDTNLTGMVATTYINQPNATSKLETTDIDMLGYNATYFDGIYYKSDLPAMMVVRPDGTNDMNLDLFSFGFMSATPVGDFVAGQEVVKFAVDVKSAGECTVVTEVSDATIDGDTTADVADATVSTVTTCNATVVEEKPTEAPTEEPTEPSFDPTGEHIYTAVGATPLFSPEWDPTADAYNLSDPEGDGVYSITLPVTPDMWDSDVAYKVAADKAWDFSFNDRGQATGLDSNAYIYIEEGSTAVVITFDTATLCTTAVAKGATTEDPTNAPTQDPTDAPTEVPTQAPTEAPTAIATEAPTTDKTDAPTSKPTEAPTKDSNNSSSDSKDDTTPGKVATGDSTSVSVLLVVLMLAGTAVVATRKRMAR
ncbi:MAG: hypothetical protein U0O22_08340 [Acutalibacteraceae bacterium]